MLRQLLTFAGGSLCAQWHQRALERKSVGANGECVPDIGETTQNPQGLMGPMPPAVLA